MNQKQRIEKYINEFGSITPMDAFMDLGITKLATRISEMIRDGMLIEKKSVNAKNRFGKPVTYMSYSIRSDDNG